MTIAWKSFTINNVGEAENWSPVEVAFHKNIIDTVVGDCCTVGMDTAGHKHKSFYNTLGTVIALSSDVSGNLRIVDDLELRFGTGGLYEGAPDYMASIVYDSDASELLISTVFGSAPSDIRLKVIEQYATITLENLNASFEINAYNSIFTGEGVAVPVVTGPTGDPSGLSEIEGMMYLNTYSNVKALRMYAGGQWRTVFSW